MSQSKPDPTGDYRKTEKKTTVTVSVESASTKSGTGEGKSFEELSEESQIGLLREFVDFLKYNKKWWLTPIIAVLLLVGLMIFLTTSGAAPFLYTFW